MICYPGGRSKFSIPSYVSSIGPKAFYGCKNLSDITIPNLENGITNIGEEAFRECSSLVNIDIPNSVTEICYGAFEGCSSLKDITLSSSLIKIGDHAFKGCISLQNITLPNSVTDIGNYAFGECSSLKSIYIPHGVERLDNFAFGYSENLASINVDNGNPNYSSQDGVLFDKNKTILEGGIKTLSPDTMEMTQALTVCEYYNIDYNKPLKDFTRKELDILFYGSKDKIDFKYVSKNGNTRYTSEYYEGIINTNERRHLETTSSWRREWLETFMVESPCPVCSGSRLSPTVLAVKINKKNIFEVTNFSIIELRDFIASLKLSNEQKEISGLVTKEILNRLDFLKNVFGEQTKKCRQHTYTAPDLIKTTVGFGMQMKVDCLCVFPWFPWDLTMPHP